MTVQEKLNQLEELLDIETNTLSEEMELEDIDEWDSMAVISVIAMFDDDFSKVVTPDQIKGFKTVKDIIDEMN